MAGAGPESGDSRATAASAGSDVFISYASQDKVLADTVCEALERNGVVCWIAPRNVSPGEFYADAIVRALNDARVVVLVLTENSVSSPHVLREVERTSAKRHPIVSLRLASIPLPPALEYFLSASHWLDASASGIGSAIPKLVEAVRRLVAQPSGVGPSQAGDSVKPAADPSPRPPTTRAGARLSRPVIAVVGLALACVVIGKVWVAQHAASGGPVAAVAPGAAPTALAIPEKSVAVLPFVDMSEKKDQEYFAGGMADEVLNLLAKIPDLKVIGRASSFQFKGQGEDLRSVGAKLGVAYVLEGSVRRSDDRVRVSAQLIDTRTGTNQWSETFDRQFGDVLKMQDEIAAGVAVALAVTFNADDPRYRRELAIPRVYDLYLRGRHAEFRWDKVGFEEAIVYFRQALDLDPTFVPAAYGLAHAYFDQATWSLVAPSQGFPRARTAIESALELDTKAGDATGARADAHAVLAYIRVMFDWDWTGAETELQQALALAPHDPRVLNVAMEVMAATGRWDEAVRYGTLTTALDPLSAPAYENLGMTRYRSGRMPEAEAALRRVLELSPTYAWGHYYLACILLAQAKREAALAAIQEEALDGGRDIGLAIVYASLSRKSDSDKALTRAIAEYAELAAYHVAGAYAFRGDLDSAIAWLDRAYRQKDAELYRLKGNPLFRNLERDPRYKALLRKMNLPE